MVINYGFYYSLSSDLKVVWSHRILIQIILATKTLMTFNLDPKYQCYINLVNGFQTNILIIIKTQALLQILLMEHLKHF